MDQEKSRRRAISEGEVFEKTNPRDPNWEWNSETVDVEIFTRCSIAGNGFLSARKWISFWESEFKERRRYFRQLEKDLFTNEISIPPIIIAFHEPDLIDIGDGWHRIAIAVKNDLKTIRAIVGRKSNLAE